MNMPIAQGSSGFASSHYKPKPFCIGCGMDEMLCECKQMKQTKQSSFTEALVNTVIGYGIALVGQIVIFPLFGIHVSLEDNLLIGSIFMLISTARSYVIRRVMERLRVTGIMP